MESRFIYHNPWIHVREDKVLRPQGDGGVYGVVEFTNLAIGVVAVNPAGEVVLVGQHRYPLDYYSWEIPEGGCPKKSDTPEKAAARELREETGLEATRWNYLGCLALSNSVTDEITHLFLARDLIPGPPSPDPTEILEIKWLSLDEACRQVLEGEITESISIAGLLRARHFLQREKAGRTPAEYRREP
jgi:8-oxo-dGTP pyrophosphatase MutT (NUDIX family)